MRTNDNGQPDLNIFLSARKLLELADKLFTFNNGVIVPAYAGYSLYLVDDNILYAPDNDAKIRRQKNHWEGIGRQFQMSRKEDPYTMAFARQRPRSDTVVERPEAVLVDQIVAAERKRSKMPYIIGAVVGGIATLGVGGLLGVRAFSNDSGYMPPPRGEPAIIEPFDGGSSSFPLVAPEKPTNTPTSVVIPLNQRVENDLYRHVQGIDECNKDAEHRRVIEAAKIQVIEDIYNNGLAADEKIAWEYIKGAIGFVVPELCRIDVNGYTDMDLRQVLMPRELRFVDIMTGSDTAPDSVRLEMALKNVTFDPELGMSPQEWLRKEVLRVYNDGTLPEHSGAFRNLLNKPGYGGEDGKLPIWANSYENWIRVINDLQNKHEDSLLFLLGFYSEISHEAANLGLGQLTSRSFIPPLAGYSISADYPGGDNLHTELAIKYNNKLIHFWMDEKAFLEDYKGDGKINRPSIYFIGPDDKPYNPYTLQLKN